MTALAQDKIVAVVGCGAMGAGIAQVAATAGHQVLLFDADAQAPERATAAIGKFLDAAVARGRIGATQRAAILGRIKPCAALADLAPATLVVEAVVEDLRVKQKLFGDLEKIVGTEAILASNTSSLSITAIAHFLERPERIVGMHFFNPAPLLPLVEVVSGLDTAPAIAATIFDTAKAWGKQPVHCRSTPGFIVNRCARPFYAEGLRLLAERALDPSTLDGVMREAGGFRMGPCELMDLIGHDVNFAVTRVIHAAFFGDPRYQPSLVQQALVDAGRFGRKSGRGLYDYRPGAANPPPATAAAAPRPNRAIIEGHLGPGEGLISRIERAGIAHTRSESRDGDGAIVLDGAVLRLTDGRTATIRAAAHERDLVLFDLAYDYGKTTRIALAAADQASAAAREKAAGFFQALGVAVSPIDDVPGLVVMRTIAMLANEAMDAVQAGVASPEGVDLAMTSGVNYPRGPFAWAEALGLQR
ncbi:MAG TPA: 3-hydroxyacyl-CoA dehydrogenase, partial [Alphaproteobacteria bacterium]|nr:3-hydroxyacyl-CoA dehydrogenase [Alphaproteobacteria bacterium]